MAEEAKWGNSEEREFIDTTMKLLKRDIDADKHNRLQAVEDLRFRLGNGEQWDPTEKSRRKQSGRPVLEINLLPKYVKQVTGDERHNRPRIKVRPANRKGSSALARIREGILWDTEYRSHAESIYDQACNMQVTCGYGAWRVGSRYTEDNPFLQELFMEPIPNPLVLYLDCDAKDPTGLDAKHGFILNRMPIEDFKDEYPGKEVPGDTILSGPGMSYEHWYDGETVTVAEYFVKESERVEMVQLESGDVMTQEQFDQKRKDWEDTWGDPAVSALRSPISAVLPPLGHPPSPIPGNPLSPPPPPPSLPAPSNEEEKEPQIAKKRTIEKPKIMRYILTCLEILEGPKRIPGRFIPLVPVYGEELNIEGKRHVEGLIRQAKDPQKLFNYWTTSAAEVVALAPKSPWIGTAEQFEGYENDYANANTQNFPFLKYNHIEGQERPSRVGIGEVPVALFTQANMARENMKEVIGMFDSDVGQKGPEITGAAVIQKQKPGDIGTYAYLDNLSRAIAHSGRIMNSMIPEIYDTERDVRLRNIDGSETWVPINTTAGNALKSIAENPALFQGMDIQELRKNIAQHGKEAKFNDMTEGEFEVMVTVGPSYSTQRSEAAENMLRLVNSVPKIGEVAADIIVKDLDFKDADELSQRLRKTLPLGLIEPKEGEPPPTPLPPPPLVQIQLAKLEIEKQRLEMMRLKAGKEGIETKQNLKKMVLDILQELYAPTHPADGNLA